jgi:hypothetical protein
VVIGDEPANHQRQAPPEIAVSRGEGELLTVPKPRGDGGAGSSSQFIGGLVVALLYVVIGLLSAIGSILMFRRIFQGRWEEIFWTSFLVVIAAFYLSFAAYFGASTHAWQTEVVGVAVFLVCAVGGLFSRSAIAVGYVMHGLWDLSHCLSGSSLAGLSITEIPLGYGIFCSTYRFYGRVLSHDK